MNDWYGKHLRAMGERSLLDAPAGDEVYRFLWLRSFDHPIFVRVEQHRGETRLSTVELTGAGGYEPGGILRKDSRSLDRAAWCEFLALLAQAKYWSLPTDEPSRMGTDGAQWVLEGVKDGRHHVVDRWTPKTGQYREACLHLLRLSGIVLEDLKDTLY